MCLQGMRRVAHVHRHIDWHDDILSNDEKKVSLRFMIDFCFAEKKKYTNPIVKSSSLMRASKAHV